MPEPRTRIRLCGPLALEIDGRDVAAGVPAGQARSLLAFLLARHGGPVERGELIDVLRPERPPRDPPSSPTAANARSSPGWRRTSAAR